MEHRKYELRILPMFERDLNGIVDISAIEIPAEALDVTNQMEDFVEEVEKAIYKRLDSAEAFAPYPSAKKRKHCYYGIRIKNYIIFYVVVGNVMEVRRILYQKRNLEKEL